MRGEGSRSIIQKRPPDMTPEEHKQHGDVADAELIKQPRRLATSFARLNNGILEHRELQKCAAPPLYPASERRLQ